MPHGKASRRRRWASSFAVGFAASTLCAILFASQFVTMSPRLEVKQVTFVQALSGTLAYCYVWALLSIAIVPLARRFPIGQGRWRTGLLTLTSAGAVFIVVQVVVFASLVWLLVNNGALESRSEQAAEPWTAYFRFQFTTTIHTNIFVYAAILGVIHAVDYHRKYRDRDLRTSRLEAQLANAQLSALRMQLHPHFLFNTLNAIAALTRDDPRAAEQMIVRLSELLRMVLDNVGSQEQALRDELALLRKYLEIEQVRFGARLQVRTHIDSSELDMLVPTLILQPLVENAVRYGVSLRPESCQIEITAGRSNGRLNLVVRDTGPGIATTDMETLREGVGLTNTRARLRQLYGDAQSVRVESRTGGGFEVCISIPRRCEAVPHDDLRHADPIGHDETPMGLPNADT